MLWLIALAMHAAWALTVPTPVDWDPAYYASVARHVAEGAGAISQSVVFLGSAPESLPMAADAHWSPLPSRVLVPAVWLWPRHGAQLTAVVLAAAWAPLAWALARAAKADDRTALMAGVFAATGAGFARMLSSPDSIGLAGLLGGLAMLAVLRERWMTLALALSALVLTRGDGLVAAAAIAVAAWDRRALPGLALAAATWLGWRWGHPTDEALFHATHYREWVLGLEPTGSRLGATWTATTKGSTAWLIAGAGVWPICALFGAWRQRLGVLFVVTGAATLAAAAVLAPALAESGTVYRSGAVLAPAGFALAAMGIERASGWAVSARGYPRWMLPGLLGGGGVVAALALGSMNARLMPSEAVSCQGLTDDVVFASQPLALEHACGARAVLYPHDLPAERVQELADRFGITEVVDGGEVYTLGQAREAEAGW